MLLLRLSIVPISSGLVGSDGLDEFTPMVVMLEELHRLDGLDGLKAVC